MNPRAEPRHLLLVDDHPLFHEGLASALRSAGGAFELASAGTVAEGLAHLAAQPSLDLLLIDVMLPDSHGLDALLRFGAAAPALPRVLVSGRVDAAVVAQARRLGASAFIDKAWSLARILACLEQVLAGGVDFSVLDQPDAAPAPTLTQRQLGVLQLLARGCSNKEIARELSIAERTVRAHLTELFQVLGASSRVQAVLNAQRSGLIAPHGSLA